MNIKEIRELLQLMNEHEIGELELDNEGVRLKVKKLLGQIQASAPMMSVQHLSMPTAASQALSVAPQTPTPVTVDTELIKSPMVGTFYTAPSPDQPAFVSVGSRIESGDVICIIEAMKLMNEMKAEISGEVVEILVKNGQAVEFDQPLLKVKKS